MNLAKRDINELDTRSSILALEKKMMGMESCMDELTLKHYFAPGVYAREIFLPKDKLVIGKIHKHAHLNIISKGKVMVATEFGKDIFEAPYTFTSKPGTKRAVIAIEDAIWTTIHLTEETDLEKIEDEIIAKSFGEYDKLEDMK